MDKKGCLIAAGLIVACVFCAIAGLFALGWWRPGDSFEDTRTKPSAEVEAKIERDADKLRQEREKAVLPNTPVVPPLETAEVRGAAEQNDPPVSLQGISWNNEIPLAMINDRLYKTGDKVGSRTIVKILPHGIIVRTADGRENEIRLIKEISL